MNTSVYIFENLSVGYTQYPTDYTASIFKESLKYATKSSQVIVHRDGHLMYYIYVRELQNKQQFGLCVVVNGLMISAFKRMFKMFENTIETLLVSGSILHLTKEGQLEAVGNLVLQEEDVSLLRDRLSTDFAKLEQWSNALPPVDYAISSAESRIFSIEEDNRTLLQASHTYGYTIIQKDKDFESSNLKSYRGTLAQLTKENNTLKAKNAELNKKKENVTKVMWLAFSLIILMLIGLIVYGNMSDSIANLQYRLSKAQETIEANNKTIDEQDRQITGYQAQVRTLNQTIASKENTITEQTTTINKQKKELAQKDEKIKTQQKTISKHESTIRQQETTISNQKSEINRLKKSSTTSSTSSSSSYNSSSRSSSSPYLSLSYLSYDSASGDIKFNYYSSEKQTVNLTIRVKYPEGHTEDFVRSVSLKKGSNSNKKVFVKRGLYSSKYYYTIEVIHNGKVLQTTKY